MKRLLERIREMLSKRRTRRILTRVVSIVGAFVVFVTTYALVLPAITMENQAACGIEEHQHDDSCFEMQLICGEEESETHQHTDGCYERVLVCGKQVHTHSTECYETFEETREEPADTDMGTEEATESGQAAETDSPVTEDAAADGIRDTDSTDASAADADQDETGSEQADTKDSDPGRSGSAEKSNADSTDKSSSGSSSVKTDTVNGGEGTIKGESIDAAEAAGVDGKTYAGLQATLDLAGVLSDSTDLYYYPAQYDENGNADTAGVNSGTVTDWGRVEDDTQIASADFVRVYLAYTIPAGTLNKNHYTARYRLPGALRLTDDQVEAINKNKNGVSRDRAASPGITGSSADAGLEADFPMDEETWLGAEAIEGTRTPDKTPDKDETEYISATVKVENIYKDGKFRGQDLVLTFTPYTVRKNQTTYAAEGQTLTEGEKVRGFFTLDLNPDQISCDGSGTAEILFAEKNDFDDVAAGTFAQEEIRRVLHLKDHQDGTAGNNTAGNVASAEDTNDTATETDNTDKTDYTAEGNQTEENKDKETDAENTDGSDTEAAARTDGPEDEEKFLTGSVIAASGEAYEINVTYGDDAQIPDGSELRVREILENESEYKDYAEQAVEKVEEAAAQTAEENAGAGTADNAAATKTADSTGNSDGNGSEGQALPRKSNGYVRVFDIEIWHNGQKIEPSAEVLVEIRLLDAPENKETNLDVVHFAEDGPEVLSTDQNTNTQDTADTSIQFTTDAFSVYTIVGTETITVPFVASDGKTYEVTIAYGPEAGIPAGAELIVSELSEDGEEYQDYLEQTADAVGTAADALNYLKILDISIMNGEEKVVIQAPVDVQIKLLDKDNTEETGEKTKVVHFGESETDVIDPELNGITVNFEATGFSYYAVTTYGATSDLDGKSYAIVQVNTQATEDQSTGNNTVYAGRALTTSASNQNTRLAGATVTVETHESGLNLVSSGTTQIVEWEFESAEGANTYYIKAPNGQYLTLNGTALALSNTPQALTVTAGSGTTAGKVRISYGNRRVQSSVSAAAARTASNTQYFYNGNSNDANYVYLTLCEIEEFDPNQYPVYSGEKISVQDLVDGQKYILYKNIYNEMTEQYEDWVIDGNGNPVRAYDQGDSLSLHSEISPMWTLSILVNSAGQPTGYYIFRNEETGLILHPMADGTLVKEYDAATSPTQDGVSLKGREGGDYTSTIEYWDGSAMAYYGYQFTTDGEVVLSSGTGNNSQAFSFAEEKTTQTGLHTVATVDSAAAGVTIRMFNYPNRTTIANVTGSDSYGVGVLPAQHVRSTLVNGYPVFTNGNSGSTLFAPSSTYYQGTGNHLFLESVYDSTGYYEYSAFNNFAHYNSNDGSFTVYQETGTPNPTASNFFYRRGNFFPYNSLNTNNSSQNIYTGDGTLIDYENPNYGSTLYGLSGTTDYYFGMTMDFNFLMPKDGYEKGNPLIYEFNGDDDLWIYIDGVLILDIGGVHDAFPGTINFATGEIIGGNGGAGGATTIKECFENAGVFPDGTLWDDSKVDEYFDGDTFVSYGSHQFNMFYMEHGAGASNLQTRFNLPVIEKGKVTVEKQLDNTSQVDYANVSFAYQAFAKDEHGAYQPLTSAVYEGTDTPLTFYNNVMIGENGPYDNVFYLKPREAAVFSDMIEDELYYVQEIGIKTDYYDEVLVNDVRIEGEQVIEEEGIYKSTEATARNRARVTFTNKLNEKNSNELRITKRLAEGSVDNGDTFEFRVMLENASGVLSAYYQGTYYIRDDDGVYYRYEGGNLVPNGQTPYACTAGNYGTIAQIPPDFTVVIKDLVSDTDFYVDEIRVRPNGSSSDVLIGESDWTLVSTDVTDAAEGEITDADIYDYATGTTIQGSSMGRIELEKDAQVVFTNKMASVDVQLKKVKEDGTTTISGSVFDLNKYSGSWTSIQTDIKPGEAATDTTPAVPNPVDLGELTIGRYRLTETKSPDGYIILTKHVYFEVYKDTDGDLKARLTDEAGTAVDSPTDVAAIDGPGTGDTPTYTVTITNTPGAVLPNTGGSGTLPYTLGGIALIMASALMYGFRMRRRERRLN